MVKKEKYVMTKVLLVITVLILQSNLIYGEGWYKGTLHIHTGYSSKAGYDSDINTESDNCPLESVNPTGFNISQLKTQASGNLEWLWLLMIMVLFPI